MKEMMNRAKSFLTFDFPLQNEYISNQFAVEHACKQKDFPHWSTRATRQKMIYLYWFNSVTKHFSLLLGMAILVNLPLYGKFETSYLFAILLAGSITFGILYFFQYRPSFCAIFLPTLETVKEMYEHKQYEQQEKCRQAQLSNFSLALIYYVLTNINNMNAPACDDRTASLLMKLYGVDAGSLKKNLELILVASKRKNITDRKITELRNRFNETYSFFEELQFIAGIQKLKELELKIFNG